MRRNFLERLPRINLDVKIARVSRQTRHNILVSPADIESVNQKIEMLPGSLALAIEFNLFLRSSEQEPHWANVIAGCSTCNEAQTKCVRDTSVVSIVPLDRDSPFMPGKHGIKVRSDTTFKMELSPKAKRFMRAPSKTSPLN